jgi:hypothetical protein
MGGDSLLLLLQGGSRQDAKESQGDVMQRVMAHFENPSKLLTGVKVAELYTSREVGLITEKQNHWQTTGVVEIHWEDLST